MFGQAFFPSLGRSPLGVAVSLNCLWLLVACTGDAGERLQSGRVLPWAGLEGRWVGPVTPSDPGCGVGVVGLMSIGSDTFAFDPFQSTAVLRGKVGSAGDLVGKATRPVLAGSSITMEFLGRVTRSESDERIVGTLISGRCHWSVILFRG